MPSFPKSIFRGPPAEVEASVLPPKQPPKPPKVEKSNKKGSRRLSKSLFKSKSLRISGSGSRARSNSTIQSSGSIHSISDIIGCQSLDVSFQEISIAEDLEVDDQFQSDCEGDTCDCPHNSSHRSLQNCHTSHKSQKGFIEEGAGPSTSTTWADSLDESWHRDGLQSLAGSQQTGSNIHPLHCYASEVEIEVQASINTPEEEIRNRRDMLVRRRSTGTVDVHSRKLELLLQDKEEICREREVVSAKVEEMNHKLRALRNGELVEPPPTASPGWGRFFGRARTAAKEDRVEYQVGVTSIQIAALQRELIWLTEKEAAVDKKYRRLRVKSLGKLPEDS